MTRPIPTDMSRCSLCGGREGGSALFQPHPTNQNQTSQFAYLPVTRPIPTTIEPPNQNPNRNQERRICQTVLKQLDDQSNDVQSIAVKCLGILFKRVQEAQVRASWGVGRRRAYFMSPNYPPRYPESTTPMHLKKNHNKTHR